MSASPTAAQSQPRRPSRAATMVLRSVRPYGDPPVDITIRDGRIDSVDPAGAGPRAATVLHADGLVALPGLVDLHTHLREPGGEAAETIATGTRAAAAGGYTEVFAMANTSPVCDAPERVRAVLDRAATSAACRVHPVGAITVGLHGEELAPLEAMADTGAHVFSDDGHCVDNPALMGAALRTAARRRLVIAQHAQDGQLAGDGQINDSATCCHTELTPWPATAEEIIIARDVVLAGHAGAALHICHLSTAGSVEIVRWAKSQGWRVTAEVTPHHLVLTEDLAALSDSRYKVNPPLRTPADVAALRAGLRDGTIDAVATDHAPHLAAAKARAWSSAPYGMTGLETALSIVAQVLNEPSGPDWHLLAMAMSTAPARIGNIADRAGRPLRPGEPASLCLVDLDANWTVHENNRHSRSANTPFAGTRFTHRVVATMLDGRLTHTTDTFATRIEERA